MHVVEAADVEKQATKTALKQQLSKLASKGIDSLLEPPAGQAEKGDQKEVEGENGDQKEVEGEKGDQQGVELEGTFPNGAKVRMVVESEAHKRFLSETAVVEKALPLDHL